MRYVISLHYEDYSREEICSAKTPLDDHFDSESMISCSATQGALCFQSSPNRCKMDFSDDSSKKKKRKSEDKKREKIKQVEKEKKNMEFPPYFQTYVHFKPLQRLLPIY